MLTATVNPYTLSQAANDMAQVLPIVIVSGTLMMALVLDLILPRPIRGGGVALMATAGFGAALVAAALLWNGGGTAYYGFATGDTFARFFEALFATLGILTVAISHGYLRRRGLPPAEFHILILASVAGMMALAAATSLVSIFLGLELLSISLYIACGYLRHDTRSQEAATKYLMIGGFASAFVLYGMALIYGASGSTLLPEIALRITDQGNPLLILGVTLLGVGFAFKVSGAPFHQWTPDVYQGAPLPVTAFMSVGTKAAAFAMIIRVFTTGLPHAGSQWQGLLAFVAVASLVVGNLLAIVQVSLKRLLAYSSIAQAGYILIGVLAGGRAGLAAVLFYLTAYLVMNFGAFALLTALSGARGDVDRMSDLDGLGRRHPVWGVMMTVFMLSLAGLPTTVGFIGKLYLFTAGVDQGYTWLVIVAAVASAVSFYYYVRVLIHVWSPKSAETSPTPGFNPATVVVGCAALATVLLGLSPLIGSLFGLGLSGVGQMVAAP